MKLFAVLFATTLAVAAPVTACCGAYTNGRYDVTFDEYDLKPLKKGEKK